MKNTGKAFHFRYFSLNDDNSSMKTGTDAVLLGAWSQCTHANEILDVGTGCGILALMSAQRSLAFITAIDIDADSVIQARENVIQCPWPDRIRVLQGSMQEFSLHPHKKYDLIVSNPPYFSRSLPSNDIVRNKARHDENLDPESFMKSASLLISGQGFVSIIIPFHRLDHWISAATFYGFYPCRLTEVIPREGKAVNRCLLQFSTQARPLVRDRLVILGSDGKRTREYSELTRDFYLEPDDPRLG